MISSNMDIWSDSFCCQALIYWCQLSNYIWGVYDNYCCHINKTHEQHFNQSITFFNKKYRCIFSRFNLKKYLHVLISSHRFSTVDKSHYAVCVGIRVWICVCIAYRACLTDHLWETLISANLPKPYLSLAIGCFEKKETKGKNQRVNSWWETEFKIQKGTEFTQGNTEHFIRERFKLSAV